jgi:hypothetical protein
MPHLEPLSPSKSSSKPATPSTSAKKAILKAKAENVGSVKRIAKKAKIESQDSQQV